VVTIGFASGSDGGAINVCNIRCVQLPRIYQLCRYCEVCLTDSMLPEKILVILQICYSIFIVFGNQLTGLYTARYVFLLLLAHYFSLIKLAVLPSFVSHSHFIVLYICMWLCCGLCNTVFDSKFFRHTLLSWHASTLHPHSHLHVHNGIRKPLLGLR
jgi:hypothetical protein